MPDFVPERTVPFVTFLSGFLVSHVEGSDFQAAFEKVLGRMLVADTLATEPEKFPDRMFVMF